MANCTQCGRKLPPLMFGKKICQWCAHHEAVQRGDVDENARQPVMPMPWVQRESSITLTQVIFGANLAVFLAMAASSGTVTDFPFDVSVRLGANYGPLTLSGQWWRLVTYMFLHGGLMHIAFNMWCLWDLGALCESLYGRWTFGAIYLLTGIAGGIASIAWNPGVWSVGASGAIFGLAGALIASFALGEFSLPRIAIQGTLRSLVFFVGFNVVFGSLAGGVDNAAHAGGLVSGLILGALIARVAPFHDRLLPRAGVLCFAALLVVGSAFGLQRWRGSAMNFAQFARARAATLDRAVSDLQKKTQQNPTDASAHIALAHAYFAKRQVADGIAELRRALDLQPQNTKALRDLGVAYLRQSQSREAQETFGKLIALEPNNAEAHAGMGLALADLQDHKAAVDEFKTALQLNPEIEELHYRMGISQTVLKQYDEAIASFLKEREKAGDYADLESAMADAYQGKGMQQEAQQARNKAMQLRSQETD